MPEHQDLDIFRRTRAGQEDKPSERLTGEQVDQPYHHAPHVAPEQPAATRALANSNQQVNLGDILSGTHKVTRIKLIKRRLYGRASFALLRTLVLAQPP